MTADRESSTPTHCPFCQSNSIGVKDRKVTDASYWRCEKCGELWNPGRLRAPRPLDFRLR
jgi:transposase-like protein